MIKRWLQEGTPRQRIAELEAHVAQLTEERNHLKVERDDLRLQLMQANNYNIERASRLMEALAERDALCQQLDTVTAERDSLQGYLDRANEGRLKAQAQLEEVLLARTHVPKPRRQAKPPTTTD